MKISELEKILKDAKKHLGDWDSTKGIDAFKITGINYEWEHIEITN